jgi:hypothetical protein
LSIFKSKWIVLKIDKVNWTGGSREDTLGCKVRPWEFLYTIFTKEYWKIKCNKKLSKIEKTLDLWYLVNFEITTKENVSIHKIRNLKILSEFSRNNKTFSELNAYLTILSIIYQKTPNWYPIYELFNLLELVNSYPKIDETKLILTRLKIISIFWELNENNNNETVSKILKFINANKIERILKLTGISEEIKKELEIL